MRDRSRRGQPPTAHELQLIAEADTRRITDAMGQWVLLAQRHGPVGVLAVLDEFAGEKLWIPGRQAFFDALWRPRRDDAIRAAVAAGTPACELAAAHGLSREAVRLIVTGRRADTCTAGAVKARR